MKYLQKCIDLFFNQYTEYYFDQENYESKPAKTLSCTKLQW